METLRRYALLALVIFLLSGCIKPEVADGGGEVVEVLDVEPIVNEYFLGGFSGPREGMLFVVAGSLDEAKERSKKVLIENVQPTKNFGKNDVLNFVVFRGFFSSGGYKVEIEKIEKKGYLFDIYAIFHEPGRDMPVTAAITQPTAIIPIGKIESGTFTINLWVREVQDTPSEVIEKEIKRLYHSLTIIVI